MKTRKLLSILIALGFAALLLGSCELALGPRSEGTIVLNLGGRPSSRAFSDAPFDGLPVFSSFTVTVSGSGMPTASQTVPGTTTSVTLQVPAGPARKVEVYAVVDWASTPQTPQPTLAKAYGGTAIVDVAGGQTIPVAMDMAVVETKIVLPDSGGWSIADSISSDPVSYDWSYLGGFFQFDRFGRLITLDGQNGVTLTTEPYDSQYIGGVFSNQAFTYSKSQDGLYIATSGIELTFMDSSYTTSILSLDQAFETVDAVAVDEEGYIYLAGYSRVAKYLVDHTQGTVSQVGSVTYESLGLGYWVTSGETYFNPLTVRDMTIHEGRLFILADEIVAYDYMYGTDAVSRGKIVEASILDLSKSAEFGWTNDKIPPQNTTSLLYGPRRFIAIAPRKLIFADDGFWWTGQTYTFALENRNGIGVLNLDTETLSRMEIAGVEFFESFSSLTIY